MVSELFSVGRGNTDFIFVACTALSAIFAFVTARIPNIIAMANDAFIYKREHIFATYVVRYFSLNLFKVLGHWQSAFGVALLLFIYTWRKGLLKLGETELNISFFGLALATFLLFFFVHRLCYRAWGILFPVVSSREQWRIFYSMTEWVWSACLFVCIMLAVSPIPVSVACTAAAVFFLVWRIILIVKTISLHRGGNVGEVHLFLYLCAHEILPFAYIGVAVWWFVSSKVPVR